MYVAGAPRNRGWRRLHANRIPPSARERNAWGSRRRTRSRRARWGSLQRCRAWTAVRTARWTCDIPLSNSVASCRRTGVWHQPERYAPHLVPPQLASVSSHFAPRNGVRSTVQCIYCNTRKMIRYSDYEISMNSQWSRAIFISILRQESNEYRDRFFRIATEKSD